MEVRQLHYFLTLCEELNYSRAAQRLYLSRQALRQNIAALEQELGEPLFLNQRNHISLTERGEWLRQHAAPVVKSFEQLQQELAATLRPAGPVCFGVSQALLPDYLPRLPYQLELLKTVYSNFQLEIQLLSNDEILRGLAEGRLALGLVMDQSSAVYPFEKRILRQDPFCLMAAQEHPLSHCSSLKAEQLQNQAILIPSLRPEPFGPFAQLCRAAGFEPHFLLAPSFYEANYQVRSQGLLCVTRPESAPKSIYSPTVELPVQGAEPLCVSLLFSREANPTVARLVQQYLVEHCLEL